MYGREQDVNRPATAEGLDRVADAVGAIDRADADRACRERLRRDYAALSWNRQERQSVAAHPELEILSGQRCIRRCHVNRVVTGVEVDALCEDCAGLGGERDAPGVARIGLVDPVHFEILTGSGGVAPCKRQRHLDAVGLIRGQILDRAGTEPVDVVVRLRATRAGATQRRDAGLGDGDGVVRALVVAAVVVASGGEQHDVRVLRQKLTQALCIEPA